MTHLKNFSDGTDAINALAVDNLKLDGNTISSTDTNGDITLDPDGTGDTIIASGDVGGQSTTRGKLTVKTANATASDADFDVIGLASEQVWQNPTKPPRFLPRLTLQTLGLQSATVMLRRVTTQYLAQMTIRVAIL